MWRFHKNLEIEISLDLAIPLLCMYSKDYKSFFCKDTCTRMFIVALFTIAKTWNQFKCTSMIDRLKKIWHIQHGILCSHKKGWVHVLCRDMDESGNHHSQRTDTRTENQTPHVLTYKWELNDETTWTHRVEQHTLGPIRGWRVEWGRGSGRITNRYQA